MDALRPTFVWLPGVESNSHAANPRRRPTIRTYVRFDKLQERSDIHLEAISYEVDSTVTRRATSRATAVRTPPISIVSGPPNGALSATVTTAPGRNPSDPT